MRTLAALALPAALVFPIMLAVLAGCAAESTAPPVSRDTVISPSKQEPQPPGSLPPGAATDAPLTRPTGDLATFGGKSRAVRP